MGRLDALVAWLSGTAIRESVEKLPEVQRLRKFARSFNPIEGVDYKWFMEQAAKEFDFAESRTKSLEEKADKVIAYLGATEGILTFGMTYVVSFGHPKFLWVSVPTLIAFFAAIMLALISRSPALHPAFPSPQEFLEKYPQGNPAKFAARISATSGIASLANAAKARLVRRAHWLLAIGLGWFVVSALVYSVCG
jgi:hypothetical protein